MTVGGQDISDAAERIAGRVRRTPVLELGEMHGASVVAKLELLQHTGSFKPRGAFNKLLSSEVPPAGVIAASGGNFGPRSPTPPARPACPRRSSSRRAPRRRRSIGYARMVLPSRSSRGTSRRRTTRWERERRRPARCMMHPFDQPEVIAGPRDARDRDRGAGARRRHRADGRRRRRASRRDRGVVRATASVWSAWSRRAARR